MTRVTRVFATLLLLLAALAQPVGATGTTAAQARALPQSPAAPANAVVGNGSAGSCNDGTFKAAVAIGGLITFNCGGPQTIAVTGTVSITQNTTISGGGIITLTGGMGPRLFVINGGSALALNGLVIDDYYGAGGHGGAIVNHGTLTISDSTIQNSLTDSTHAGGALYTNGPALTIANTIFKNNRAGAGGVIFALAGHVQITNSRFSNNYTTDVSEGFGGAIYLASDATLSMTDGLLQSNYAVAGGALYIDRDAVVTLASTDGSHNPCPPLIGAGLTESPALCLLGPQVDGPPHFTTLQFANNSATANGGGIYNGGGQLTASGIAVFQNTVPITLETYGGGIANYGTLALLNTYLTYNKAAYGGGLAVMPNQGSGEDAVVMDDDFFFGNQASQGGALYTSAPTVLLSVSDTLFMQNYAGTAGGGVFRYDTPLALRRSALIFNTAGIGPALLSSRADTDSPGLNAVLLQDTTVSSNTATFLAGAIFNADLLELLSVTLVDNFAGVYTSATGQTNIHSTVLRNAGANCNGDHPPIDNGLNYATDMTCAFSISTQGNGLDPLLGPLVLSPYSQTYFHLPQPGSPLINGGSLNCDTLDQRGLLRLDACDIGAIETNSRPPLTYLPLIRR